MKKLDTGFLKREAEYVIDCLDQMDKASNEGVAPADIPAVVFDNDPLAMTRFTAAQKNLPVVVLLLVNVIERAIDTPPAPEPDSLKPEPLTREEIDQIKMSGGFGFRCGPVSKH